MTKWVVTSAWPYSSDIPHLGNMIGSVLSADVFARFQRLIGNEVVFVSGSDEHGTPVEVEAIKRKIPIKQLADENHARICNIFKGWNMSYDNYTRTESEIHKKFIRQIYTEIYENDSYIFTQVERIHYCPNDKRFLPDRFVEGTCPYCGFESARGDQCDNCGRPLDAERLIKAYCVICKQPTELRETTQWFFDLPKLSDYVSDYLSRAELSTNVIKFCRGWIKDGLRPRSITRDSDWGIKAPFPGAEKKTIYVWMEAVLGYVSAVIEYFEKKGTPERWKEFWLDPNAKTSFFIGKDNIPFHAIILPSLLRASGKAYNEPNLISSTEFLNFENQKFSKSRKIGIWTDEALELLPADYWRFSLVALRPEAGDVNFGWDSFTEKVNNDLNDAIGNFVNRTLVGVSKFANNRFELKLSDITKEYSDLVAQAKDRHAKVHELYCKVELQSACRSIVDQAFEANRFLSATEPWKVVKNDKTKALQILYVSLSTLKLLSSELYPIIPETALKIVKQSGVFKKSNGNPSWEDTSIDNDLPIVASGIKPIFSKVNAEEMRMKLDALRASK
ncbi:MAG: methionine--tRNA ligase [Nitrososphaerales archaeon]